MEKRKLLSVVVPTKDRYKYLKYLIELIAGFKSREIELVIQDNSDDNSEFLDYLNNLGYDFIRYDYTKGQIPMAINSDKAILNSTGEYICFLGDDDGLTRYTLDCVMWMKKNHIDAVRTSLTYYNWPDVSDGLSNSEESTLFYKKYTGRIVYKSAYKELIRVLRSGIVNRGIMPLVYHSIVSKEALDRIYLIGGTYFPGNSPDISNAVALSLVIDKYAIVDLPLAYSGCSVFHGGGVWAPGKKYPPEITDIPWFRHDAVNKWDNRVPRIAIGTFIWADSAISALKYMRREDLYKKINFYKLYSNFMLSNPNLQKIVGEVCDNKLLLYFYYGFEIVKKYALAIIRRIKRSTGISNVLKKDKISTIIEATAFIESLPINKSSIDHK